MDTETRFEVFVISLDRAVERREYISSLTNRLGFTANIVRAVDGARLSPEQRSRYDGDRARRVGSPGTELEFAL